MSKDTQGVEAAETTAQTAPAEPNTQDVTPPAEPTAPAASAETKDQIDYKAELEAAQTRLDKAEHTIVDLKRKNKVLETADTTAVPDTDITFVADKTPDEIRQEIQAEVDQRLSKLQQDLTADALDEELSKLSGNPDEQALIRFHYINTIKQSGASRGAIREDLRKAHALANQRKLEITNGELKEALKARHTAAKPVTGTNQDPQKPDELPKFSPQERAVIERRAAAAGMNFDEYVRKHKNELTH